MLPHPEKVIESLCIIVWASRSFLLEIGNTKPVSMPATSVASVAASSAPAASVFDPEFDLLLACCRAGGPKSLAAGGEFGEIHWDRLIAIAEHHGLISRLSALLGDDREAIPAAALDQLRARHQANTRQTLWLTHELLRICRHFESRGITVLPYKGPALAQLLYGDVSMRQYSDLDLLVRAEDVPKAKSAVMELGYRLGMGLSAREERAYLASGYEYTFDSSAGRNVLEIQWQILPRYYALSFEAGDFFDRAVPLKIAGETIRTLCREDLLLVLCAHAAKHAWSKLSWILEIAELACSGGLNWNVISNQASRLHMERMVQISFRAAESLLGRPEPDLLPEEFRGDAAADSVAAEVRAMILRCGDYNTETLPYFRFVMRTRERWQDRMRFLARLALTPSTGEWSAVRLPSALFPLYSIVRVFRLTRRLGTRNF